MKVSIKTKKGESFEIDVNSNDLIETIKSKVSIIKSIPNDQQHLIYNCTTLNDGEKINDYSIKNQSEIFLVQKQEAFLLQTSKIFLDSSLIDRIHQSYIDLQVKHPVQGVSILLIECISYLDEKLDSETIKELFLLILSCFSQYPEESFKIFQVKYQTPNISSLHIILLISILSQIPNNSYNDLLSNCINEIIPQIPKKQGNLNVQGFEITPEFQTMFITNLVLSIKLTEQIVTSFYQYFFSNDDFSKFNKFIEKVHSENLLTKIPESEFVENNIFLQLSFDNLANFISIISEQTFLKILQRLINFLKQKEIPPNLSSAIINKSIKFNVPPENIGGLFKYYNEFKSVSIWEYLNKNNMYLTEFFTKRFLDKVKKGDDYFAKTPLVLKVIQNVELLPQEVISYSLLNADSLEIYDYAFKSSKIECDTLGTLEFWEHLLSIASNGFSLWFNVENMCFYFQKYIKTNDMFNLYDHLIFDHFPPNENASSFLSILLNKLPETYHTEFHKHDSELVEKLIKRKELPSPYCLRLFNLELIDQNQKVTPQLLYCLAFAKTKTPNITKREIMKMTHEPHENLTKFIEQRDFDLIAKIDDESTLSFIASSIFYLSKSLIISQVSGLTCENFLPFLAIAMIYKTSRFSQSKLHIDNHYDQLFIDSCNYLNRNPSPLQIASINLILSKIYILLDSCDMQLKIIFNFIDLIFDFILKGEYKADPINFLNAVFDISRNVSSSSVRPSLFSKNELINIIVENIPKFKDFSHWGPTLDIKIFDQLTVQKTFTKLIQESTSYEPIIQTIKFINYYCKNMPLLWFFDVSNINTAIQKAIYEEKWDDALEVLKFNESRNKIISINDLNFYGKEIPLCFHQYYSKMQDINNIITFLLKTQDLEKNNQTLTILYDTLMTNKSLSMKYIAVFLEKLTSQQVISVQDIVEKQQNLNQNYLVEAIKNSYYFSKEKQKFIKKINCKQNPKIFMNFDFLTTLIQNDSYKSFICLHRIASYFPFLFEPDLSGADENNSLVAVNIVLPALNCISQIFDFENSEKNMNDFKKAFAALHFLYSCLYSVKFLSIFVIWIFENITKLTESQVFGLSYILISLFKTSEINKIILAYAIKYNFLDIITNLLKRKIPEGLFNYNYKQNLYELSSQYYRLFSNVRCKGDALLIELIQNEKISTPFENHFNNSISICPTKITPLTFTFIHQTKTLDNLFTFIEDIKIKDNFSMCAELKSNSCKSNKVTDFSRKFSDDIPIYFKSKIENIPQRITSEMYSYLLTCPKWTLNFFEKRNCFGFPSSSLLKLEDIPEYNASFSSTIEKLNKLKSSNESYSNSINSYDYFSTKVISQSFYEALIKEILNCIDINSNNDIYNLISIVNQSSYEFIKYLIQYMSDYISKPQINSLELQSLLQVLNQIWSNRKDIEKEFLEKCGNKLIDITLSNSFRSNESIISSITTILISIKSQLPKQTGQFVGLIFGCYPKLTNKAVDLYFKVNNSESFNIMPIIKMRYKKDTDEENPDFDRIKYYIENIPALTTDCILTTKNLLTKVINKYIECEYKNDQLQEMIIEIFNGVSPNPSLRSSIDKISTEKNDKSDDLLYPVPDYIKQTDPIFWGDFYEKNRPFLNEMLKKHESIVNNLSFLYTYYELISFNLRYLILKQNLNKIHGSGNGVNLDVSRSRLLLDSFGYWCSRDPKDFISRIDVYFVGENGSDGGGLTREWFTYIVKELMKPETKMFVKNETQSYHLNPEFNLNFLNVECLKMAGAIFALSIIKKTNVNAHLSTALLKQILHQEIQIDDMKNYDESLYNSFQSILSSNDVKPLDLVFSIDVLNNGDSKQVNLIENGDKVEVTNENKAEYVKLYANYKLKDSVSEQIKAFCEGFESIIDYKYIKMFTPEELDIIICGNQTIDIEDMKKNVKYEGDYNESHPVITMFYNVISKWSHENLSKLLLFITGSSTVGVCGFKEFRDNGNSLKITSTKYKDRLPVAHTCSKQLVLPEYDSEEDMNDKLLLAIQDCYFGLN